MGLMASTCFLLLRDAPGVWKGAAISAVTLALLAATRIPPVLLIVAFGALGALIDW